MSEKNNPGSKYGPIKNAPYAKEEPQEEINPVLTEDQIQYQMKVLGVLDNEYDLPKYYPNPISKDNPNPYDTSVDGYVKSIDAALSSDMDRYNFSWTIGLSPQQLQEWSQLPPEYKNYIYRQAQFLTTSYNLENELKDKADRRVNGLIAKANFEKTGITGFGYVPTEEKMAENREKAEYLSIPENIEKEKEKVFNEMYQEETQKAIEYLAPSQETFHNTKNAEPNHRSLGYAKSILPISAEIGDRYLSMFNLKNYNTPSAHSQGAKDIIGIRDDYRAENWLQNVTTTIGVVPATLTYVVFGAVSRTLTAGINIVFPGTIASMQNNLESKEIRDYRQAAGDVESQAYKNITLYTWDQVKKEYPELAQTYLEINDNNEFRAAAMFTSSQFVTEEEAKIIPEFANLLDQEQQAEIARILESKDSIGELLVSGFGSYSKYAVGSLTTGAALLLWDGDLQQQILDGTYRDGDLSKKIKQADYRPSYVFGMENTIQGNAMDLTLSIVGDPLTWLLTPGVTKSTSALITQFSTASKVKGFINGSAVGKQIVREMWEVGIKFEKGKLGVKSYNGLFSGFDVSTQVKLRKLIKEGVEAGDKGPTQLFKKLC